MSKPKKKTTVGDVIWRIVFLAALAVFCYCGYRLLTIYLEYKKGTDEYSSLEEQYVSAELFGTPDGGESGGAGGGEGVSGTLGTDTGADGSETGEGSDGTGAGTDGNGTGTGTDGAGTSNGAGGSKNLGGYNGSGTDADPFTTGETETEIVEDEDGQEVVKSYPVMRNPVDFDKLKEVNEDIIGWIRVSALDISYPIAQSIDNDYYLHRTFEREDNFAGCIFMEYQNNSDFSDKNTIIYGHNMKNGSMFGKLRKFYEEGVYESAPYFWIYTPDEIYRYDIFSCSEVGVSSKTYQITFSKEEDFAQYIDNAFTSSVVDGTDVKVTTDDRIVTLSTCTGNEATRFVVQGKLAKIYKSAKKEAKAE